MVYFFKYSLWNVFDLMPSKIFFVLLFLSRLIGFFTEIFNKRKIALVSAGILTVFCGFFLNYAYRFDGTARLGEGEILSGYDSLGKGILAKEKNIPLVPGKIKGNILRLDKEGMVELYGEKNESAMFKVGQYKKWSSGDRVSVESIEPAPRFLVADKQGKELFSMFVKLKLYPPGNVDYFRVEELPYRFYVRLTGKEDKPFNLRILRGKLIVANKDIATGDEIEVEGLKVLLPEISKWADVRVSNYPGAKVIYAGFALIVIGGIIMFFTSAKGK